MQTQLFIDGEFGREIGFEAMHEYTDAKSVWVNVDAELPARNGRG